MKHYGDITQIRACLGKRDRGISHSGNKETFSGTGGYKQWLTNYHSVQS